MCHVLIIEDEAIAAADIEHILKRVGASTFAFADTERAAISCARSQLTAVIISDVMLSAGSGVAAVRAITAELGSLPVIFITGTPKECDAIPSATVLDKPFSAEGLAAAFVAVASC